MKCHNMTHQIYIEICTHVHHKSKTYFEGDEIIELNRDQFISMEQLRIAIFMSDRVQ